MPKKSAATAAAVEGEVPAASPSRGKRKAEKVLAGDGAAAPSPKAAKKTKDEAPAKGGEKVVIQKSVLKPISPPAGKKLFKVPCLWQESDHWGAILLLLSSDFLHFLTRLSYR